MQGYEASLRRGHTLSISGVEDLKNAEGFALFHHIKRFSEPVQDLSSQPRQPIHAQNAYLRYTALLISIQV
jgi:hypothetical protein